MTLQFHPSPFHIRTAKGTQIRPENALICLRARRTRRTQHGKFTIIGSPYNIFRCLSSKRFSRRLSFHLSLVAGNTNNCTEFQLTLQFHPSPFHIRTAKGTQIRPENTLIRLCTRRTRRTQHGKFTIIGSPYTIFRQEIQRASPLSPMTGSRVTQTTAQNF